MQAREQMQRKAPPGAAGSRARVRAAPRPDAGSSARRHLGNRAVARMAVQRACACGGSCARCGGEEEGRRIQPSLVVGPTDDVYEREAERVAQRVVRMPEPGAGGAHADAAPPRIRRLAGEPSTGGGTDVALPYGGARPLSPETRAFMEPRLGADFGGVRLHEGAEAAAAADRLQARAFTYGSDVWLGRGASEGDRRLIAHELTHVVQQTGAGAAPAVQCQGGGAAATEHRFTAHGVSVVVRRSCAPEAFGFAVVEEATSGALDAIFDSECIEESRRTRIQNNLTRHGLDIRCRRSAAIDGACAEATGFDIPANIMTLGSLTFPAHPEHDTQCDPIASTVLHEIVHLVRGVFAEGLPASCEASCFGAGQATPDLCRDIDVFGRRTRPAP